MHLTAQQIRLYAQCGWIEFEEFLSEAKCKKLLEEIQTALHQRGQKKFFSAESLYMIGRDLWQDSKELKETFCSKLFSAAASTLAGKKPLQLACDQWIPQEKVLSPLNMEAHLSMQGLVCGCLLSLDGDKAGHVRFCHPDRLPLFEKQAQILIAYGSLQTVYIHNPADPNNSKLKDLGYNFGDRLLPKTHPLC